LLKVHLAKKPSRADGELSANRPGLQTIVEDGKDILIPSEGSYPNDGNLCYMDPQQHYNKHDKPDVTISFRLEVRGCRAFKR
jgi:hypothetical protein